MVGSEGAVMVDDSHRDVSLNTMKRGIEFRALDDARRESGSRLRGAHGSRDDSLSRLRGAWQAAARHARTRTHGDAGVSGCGPVS